MISRHPVSRFVQRAHGHTWLVGVAGLAAGLALLVWAPTLKAASRSIILFAGFHLLGAAVIATAAYVGWFKGSGRIKAAARAGGLVYSTGAAWLNAPFVIGLVLVAVAIVLQAARPELWAVNFLLVIGGVTFFAGSRVARSFRAAPEAVLPLVDLFDSDAAHVLDLGCGSGRSTLPLVQGDRRASVVALDAFAGETDPALMLLRRNLQVAGLEDRVEVRAGPLSPLPFADQSFDAVISVNVLDHRGGDRRQALAGVLRVLRPGGRLLLVVRTPSLATFAALNLLAFTLAWPGRWQRTAEAAGLAMLREGRFNNSWFAVLERPSSG